MPDLETAQTAFAQAQAQDVRNKANVDLGKQALIDARVEATTVGTILTKPVSIGQVIQAGATSVSGGTVIATMADLTKVRVRALVAETDIGMVKPGQVTNVVVDAFPDHPFVGKVDHIEPQATVQQNVTMFATLIAVDNNEGLLQPGMNGEVSIIADTRLDAIAVPNDAIRSPREATQAAALLGLNPDSVRAQMRASGGGGGGGGGGAPGGRGGSGGSGGSGGRGGPGGGGGGGGRGGPSAAGAGAAAGGAEAGSQLQVSNGELAFTLQQGGGQAGGQRGPQVQVTDADCKKVDLAMKKKPAVAKKIDDMRSKMRDPSTDRAKLMQDMKAAYADLGVDMQVSGACQRRARGDNASGGGAGGAGGGGRGAMGGAMAGASGGGQGAFGQQGNARHAPAHRSRVRPRGDHVGGADRSASASRTTTTRKSWRRAEGRRQGRDAQRRGPAGQRQAQNDRMKAGASPLGGSAPVAVVAASAAAGGC